VAIEAGTKLGPYEITSALGAGGMGEVYRATDTRLGRTVAIKVLPSHLSENPQFKQRFEREAKTISQLSHPHICTLHDIGHENGIDFLVMEFLEGETLAQKLAKGPLTADQSLQYGIQIADALDKAHRQGIVHRDLKPGNIMLTKGGTKLLDFGLAKFQASGPQQVMSSVSVLATEAQQNLTAEGSIVGTFQYMSPEQLEGKDADSRTDIFAFGTVLYEMITGKKAFSGKSQASLIAAILEKEPQPMSELQSMTPPVLERVVRKCLAKDPDDRWQSAHDISSELQWISDAGSAVGVATARTRSKRRLAWIGWMVAVAIAIAWIVTVFVRKPVSLPRIETSIVPPDGVMLDIARGGIALSPDGRQLAFVAHRTGEAKRLWVRDLGSSLTRPLAGTDDAMMPFWSPDGRRIAFIVGTKLYQMPVTGGSSEIVTEGQFGGAGAWTPTGEILYSNGPAIFRIPASGGTPTKLIDMPDHTLTSVQMLPDGRRFLFTSIRVRIPDAINLGSLDGSTPRPILKGVYTNTAFVPPNKILYFKDGNLRAQFVDPESFELRGESITIAEMVQYDPDISNALFTASDTGALAYVAGKGAGETELAWVTREGKDLQTVAPSAMYYAPTLSHDGSRIAIDQSNRQTASGDIWILELARNAFTRLTWDAANESVPIWTPDDRSIIFFSQKLGTGDLFEKAAAGIGNEKHLLTDQMYKLPLDISPDGRWLAFYVADSSEAQSDIWLLDRQSGKTKPYLTSPFNETELQFSPDGKWVAYVSDESGQNEVYVLQFPESSGKWMVSRDGGDQLEWAPDGQIYYLSKERKMMFVAVTPGTTFDSQPPVALFDTRVRSGYHLRNYCVSRDGSRFLLNREVAGSTARSITFVQNWISAIKK
jgi:Tol biopolymer transport system component